VVITFILTTFFSIFATSVVWWHIAYQRWNTAWEMAKEKLVPFRDAWPRGQIPGQVPKRPQSPAPHAQAQAEESDIEDLSPAENLVIALSDTCHVSGLAVATSSIIKIALTGADYPTYHLFIARCLCFLALTGYYVGQLGSSIYAKLHALHPRRLRVRVFVSALTMLMFITWSFIALPRFSAWEFNEDAVFTPQCFSTHLNTLVPFSFSFWIWANIFWIPQGFVWVLLTPWSFVGRVDVFLGKVDVLLLWVVFKVALLWTCLLDDVSHSILGAMWICVRLFFTCLATLSTLAGFVLWILFVPTDTIAVPAALLNLVWSTYDVIIAKRSNARVVVDVLQTPSPPDPGNGEMEFGFGQIFPVVMILLWCVAGIDFASGRLAFLLAAGL
jgi:hypothetical protein